MALYDFSFLDTIREITGYLIIFGTNLKQIKFKNLKIIGGTTLFEDKFSVFISNNFDLEKLDLSNLTEIQNGSVFIFYNPNLCHMNEVQWNDLNKNSKNNNIDKNGIIFQCSKCRDTCCDRNIPFKDQICGCWFPNACQKSKNLIIIAKDQYFFL